MHLVEILAIRLMVDFSGPLGRWMRAGPVEIAFLCGGTAWFLGAQHLVGARVPWVHHPRHPDASPCMYGPLLVDFLTTVLDGFYTNGNRLILRTQLN